jgi:hypothetical protein
MNTFLNMVSWLDEHDLVGTSILSEISEVKEGGLCETLNGDVAEPDEEGLALLIKHTGETPAHLSAVEADSGIELKVLHLSVLDSEELHHHLVVV